MKTEFSTVLTEYGPLISRVAGIYEANPSLRQELAQEMCLAIWLSLKKFRGDSSIKTYIMRVAHNKGVNHIAYHARRIDKSTHEAEAEIASEIDLERDTVTSRKVEQLLNAVRLLPLQSRQIVTMSMEGLSYQEIAQVCGVSASNVGVILNRAKATLKESIQNV